MSQTINELRRELKRKKGADTSWGALAAEYGVNKAVLWKIVKDHYEPRDGSLRERLGLPRLGSAIPLALDGLNHQPIVIAEERQCVGCGRWFVPNVPLRMRCHICRPVRRQRPKGR